MKLFSVLPAFLLLAACCSEPVMTWQKVSMDGSRTGVSAPNADNVVEALGSVQDGVYTAPNGRVFKGGSTAAVAQALIDVQPRMARLKEAIAYSKEEMTKGRPESLLSNFAVDALMPIFKEITGIDMDVTILNFGGIRVDMPKGEVMLDDIASMFPFRNYLCYVELKGSDLDKLITDIAEKHFMALGGVRMAIKDKKLVSVEVAGKAIDPKKTYKVGTIDFLLDGGDKLYVAKNAGKLVMTEVRLGDAMEAYVRKLTAEGKCIESKLDGRVTIE